MASNALQKIKDKRRKEADEILRKANWALTQAQNKQTKALKREGIDDRVAKRD
jgi:cellobiose-specific phosphotransferase system component IIA